ncbi:Vacuolar protein sorting-associated protein 41 [Hypoxylon texense]
MTEAKPSLGDDGINNALGNGTSEGSTGDPKTDQTSSSSTASAPEDPRDVTKRQKDGRDKVDAEEEEEEDDDDDGDDDDDEDDEDEEPKLKYARLTQHMSAVYRNGDATSAFLVAGDKMIAGTHNGNIHVIQLPDFQSVRVYHAHSASVTSISISPYPPPSLPPNLKPEAVTRAVSQSVNRPSSRHPPSSPAGQRKTQEPPQVPNLPSNNIFIGTSSMDGNVCVQSLIDLRDVQLRNFARPVQAVALSPDYRNDRTYLSGGLAGSLVLTVGAPQGRSTSTITGTAAAAASGWLGSIGIGSNTGKDTILHSGEGVISTIKWSLSGKYVVWLNEHGIKIMRTKLHLDSADVEDAWKRIGHIDRPQTDEWEEMAGVWKGRAEWIDDQTIESEAEGKGNDALGTLSPAAARLSQQAQTHDKSIERLIVGWGGTIWIIHVHPGGVGVGKHAGEKSIGRAEIVKILRMDCIISGISLYTQTLLLVLAYCKPEEEEDDDQPKLGKGERPSSSGSGPSGGIRRRHNAQPPELRLIDLTSQAEVDKDSLTVSRFERLSSNDYHLGVLPASKAASVVASRGALEALAGFGTEMWNAAINPRSLFSSGASIRSRDSNDAASSPRAGNAMASVRTGPKPASRTVHPNLIKPGAKIFIHSPYDCVLATQRDLADHLEWLLEHQNYQSAWELLNDHPEIVNTSPDRLSDLFSSSPDQRPPTADDFYEDTMSIVDEQIRFMNTSAEKEKRRIGGLWIDELIEEKNWTRAAEVVAKVVNTPHQWEKLIYRFAEAKKFDEIVDYIPSEPMHPPIPGTVYELVLNHYIQADKPRFKELLDRWGTELFDVTEITSVLENQLRFRDVREDSVDDGEKGRDWRIVMESLARLYEVNSRYREALKCYIRLQDADSAMRLIRDNHLADAVTDDVPSFIALRVPEAELNRMSVSDLEEATSEAITLLVDEAHRGLIKPGVVVEQLERKNLNLYLYFYFRGLWREYRERPVDETISLVDDFADLAVHIFVLFDRELLMDFLKVSTSYRFEEAAQECEQANYIPELVYLYSKTGRMKDALYLIIDRLSDVSQAISFAKEQDDPGLWEDLLDYSMDKPRFIRALLEEVGTAINPITLVRRIPEGLEIPGLREGLKHIMKEHEIQYSISSGVARVLRSEVAAYQNQLRNGQRKGIKFEVLAHAQDHVDVQVKEVPSVAAAKALSSPTATPRTGGTGTATPSEAQDIATLTDTDPTGDKQQKQHQHQQPGHDHRESKPGHCASCYEPFTEWETETLVGFACGHVFHITHLLEDLHPGQAVDAGLVGSSNSGDEDRTRGGRFVGSKVTHARLLRDRIEGGCPVCRGKREVVEGSKG